MTQTYHANGKLLLTGEYFILDGAVGLALPTKFGQSLSVRTALKHARVMIHQPMGGAEGQASDIEITAREIQKLKKELYEIISLHSGQTYEKVWADSDRDCWMIAEEAKAYGMIDEVLLKK
jgi:ATP-dependent Clp endopeptidase proteolytic subunit ClpP